MTARRCPNSKLAIKLPKVPRQWRKLFEDHLPGYDPIATAGHYVFDPMKADASVEFFPSFCTHVEGSMATKPFHLADWQAASVGCAFGWVDPKTRLRRYRKVFEYVPRKNGKTTKMGGLVIMVGFCDDEVGAQIYSQAYSREQATLVFRQSRYMIEANKELSENSEIFKGFKSISFPKHGVYKALSSQDGANHGLNVSFAVVDELHAHKNMEAVHTLTTGTGARSQPLIWIITTADYDRISMCNDELKYAELVRDGAIDDKTTLPVIYEAKIDDDWTDPEVWAKANPNLGVSISHEYLERECKRAQEMASYENTFKRLHLNIKTQTEHLFIKLPAWDKCGGPIDTPPGTPVWAGLDIGSTQDLTSLCLLFRLQGFYAARWWFWCPADTMIERQRKDRVPYIQWEREGFLTQTDGNETDYDTVERDILQITDHYGCRDLAADRLFQGAQLCQGLAAEGINVIPFGQGFVSMAGPTQEFERLVNRGEFRHGDNPMLRWMAGNCMVERDASDNMKPSKKKSSEKIDGIVASIEALGISMLDQNTGSVYDNPGRMSLT